MYNLLKNKRLVLTLPLFLAASLLLPLHIVPLAHANPGTGLVCITSSTSATSCPTSAPTLGPFNVGDTFSVGVFIQASDAMGGFDIFVASNPSFVSPVSAALGTLIASPSLTSICVNGSAQTGSCTVGSANGPGVVEVTTIESSGSNECGGISPCSGLAFTITYQVVGSTASTPLSYPTSPGCSASSVASPPNTCVLVADAFGTPLSENIQGASVSIALPNAVVCVTSPSTMTPCHVGPPDIGPVSVGSSFTVGVRIENSQPMGGFDIWVQVDPNYLNPTSAALGTLIASPTNTNICIDGQTVSGACNGGGQGIVEVSTIESSGLNECAAAPCSGLAFTVTYQVLLPTPTTPIAYPTGASTNTDCSTSSVSSPSNMCVLVADSFGTALPENIQGANVLQIPFVHPTSISKSCLSPVPVFQATTCTVIVTDTNTTNPVHPIGTVKWQTDSGGVYQPTNVCTLQAIGPTQPASSNCSVGYLPFAVGSGTHNISVIYLGDTVHSGTTDPFPLAVSKSTPTVSTGVVVDQTGQAPPGGFVRSGASVHDIAILTGGAPPQGVTGTVTYRLFNGGTCAGTVIFTSTVTVSLGDNVPPSLSAATPIVSVATLFSFGATYSGDSNNNAVTAGCEPFTVTPFPSITHAHFTHHLSLAKSSNTQSWTFTVNNPLTSSVSVVIHITGHSNTNPSLSFDVVCGTVCVNTPSGGVNAINATIVGPRSIAAGATVSISFGQFISSSFANNKISYSATVFWTTGTGYTSGGTNTGSFAVVP